jgi:biopolymer transport protein ExbB/TolQ
VSRTSKSFAGAIATSPLLWGGALTAGLYGLIHGGVITHPLVVRYTSGHPIEYVTIGLFFVAFAALMLRASGFGHERLALAKIDLGEVPEGGQAPTDAAELQADLDETFGRYRSTYYHRRLWSALEIIRRRGSADGLDEELKYLSDRHADERHSSGAFVRVIIWAVPMLGFLGTVIGLTTAIANLSVDANQDSINRVLSGLGAAFDTTALALALVMVMMFIQFVVDRQERRLLEDVDSATADDLAERFQTLGTADPVLRSVKQMAEAVHGAVGQMAQNVHTSIREMAEDVQRLSIRLLKEQTTLWSATIEKAQERWNTMADSHQSQLSEALSGSLEDLLRRHAETIVEGELRLAAESRTQWTTMTSSLEAATSQLADVQRRLVDQAEVARQVLEATGHVTNLETALNRNLQRLLDAGQFEETMVSLSAAMNLLTARLGNEDHGSLVRLGNRRTDPAGAKAPGPHNRLPRDPDTDEHAA